MTIYHWDLLKRKKTGGSKKPFRGKRRYEKGNEPIETMFSTAGDVAKKRSGRGGNIKLGLKRAKWVNVNLPDGRTVRAEIMSVIDNPSNALYARRGVITRGAVIKTSEGLVRVTSRPGSDGVLNGHLIAEV